MDGWYLHDSTLFRIVQDSYINILQKKESGRMWVYCRYITKNGVRIYPKNSKFFRFWVDDDGPTKEPSSYQDEE